MKKLIFILSVFILGLTVISCNTNRMTETQEETAAVDPEVWAEGITTITGKISEVKQEKDGQTIKLVNNKGIEYTAVISIPNLGDNYSQYRNFNVGEEISFKGNLIENQRMVVREVLEMR